MVEAHYFFSTLAQASAAIVGFVTAVAAVLYSLERQRVERRTDEYRDALIEFRNRYGFALRTLDAMLESEGGNTTHQMTDDLSLDNDEIEELVYETYEDKRVTSLFLAHVRRILGLINRIGPENDHILSYEELESLSESLDWFYSHFYNLDSTSKEFIKETTGKPYSAHENTATVQIFGNFDGIQGFYPSQLKNWFEERKSVESEILRPEPLKEEDDDPLFSSEDRLSGDNFWSLKTLAEYLVHDFRRVSRQANGTVIDYNSGIRPVVKVSTYLILVGVILPTMFLFNIPITFPIWFILGSQILLLAGTVVLSLTLVEFVLRSVDPTNNMGNKENLSWLSSTIVDLLPDLPH